MFFFSFVSFFFVRSTFSFLFRPISSALWIFRWVLLFRSLFFVLCFSFSFFIFSSVLLSFRLRSWLFSNFGVLIFRFQGSKVLRYVFFFFCFFFFRSF